jgi:hypothetical protein
MIQRGHGMDLALESVAEPFSGELNGHFAPHSRIASAVHLAHAAGTKWCEDLIGTKPSASRKRHVDLSDFTPGRFLRGGLILIYVHGN